MRDLRVLFIAWWLGSMPDLQEKQLSETDGSKRQGGFNGGHVCYTAKF
jgi:hypothetical protein